MTAMEIPPAALKAATAKLSQRWADDWHSTDVWINAHPDAVSEMVLEAALPHLLAEVKVLTETASKVAYALGRKDAGEEIAEALDALGEAIGVGDQRELCADLADIARDIASQPSGALSDATSGVPGHQEVSEAVRSPQEPCGHPTCPCAPQEAR